MRVTSVAVALALFAGLCHAHISGIATPQVLNLKDGDQVSITFITEADQSPVLDLVGSVGIMPADQRRDPSALGTHVGNVNFGALGHQNSGNGEFSVPFHIGSLISPLGGLHSISVAIIETSGVASDVNLKVFSTNITVNIPTGMGAPPTNGTDHGHPSGTHGGSPDQSCQCNCCPSSCSETSYGAAANAAAAPHVALAEQQPTAVQDELAKQVAYLVKMVPVLLGLLIAVILLCVGLCAMQFFRSAPRTSAAYPPRPRELFMAQDLRSDKLGPYEPIRRADDAL